MGIMRLRRRNGGISIGKGTIDNTLAELRSRQAITTLARDMADLLIEKIVVHCDQQIEIVWNGRL